MESVAIFQDFIRLLVNSSFVGKKLSANEALAGLALARSMGQEHLDRINKDSSSLAPMVNAARNLVAWLETGGQIEKRPSWLTS